MDSFELNKVIGALLASVFVVFSVSIVSDAIFASPAPENPGYAIEAAEVEESGSAEPEGPEPIGPLLASADAGAGEAIFKRCAACHTVEQGGANKVGPNLWNVVNRPIASHEGFSYSGAMQEFSQGGSVVWDYEHLSNFLLDPRGYIKGTAMSFGGLKKPEDRANVIAYLRTLSDSPAPLPDPAATPAEAAAAPAGEEAAQPAEEGAEQAPAEEEAAQPAEEGAEQTPAEAQQPSAEEAPAEQAEQPAEETEPTPLPTDDEQTETTEEEVTPLAPADEAAPEENAPAE